MRHSPQLRWALWKFTDWYRRQRFWRAFGRLMHWLWCYSAPLGTCDVCHVPTWNPVAFQVQQDIGRTGHYFCERCGPPLLDAARAFGEQVEL